MTGVFFCIVMGVLGYWIIGFRDIGYRACRRLFLGPLLVVGLEGFSSWFLLVYSSLAFCRTRSLITMAHSLALVLFGLRP
jgi:hypothetical protein